MWQPPLDSGFDQIWRKKRERDRHIDLAHAAFFACGNLFDIGYTTRDNFFEPASSKGNRRDKLGASSQHG